VSGFRNHGAGPTGNDLASPPHRDTEQKTRGEEGGGNHDYGIPPLR